MQSRRKNLTKGAGYNSCLRNVKIAVQTMTTANYASAKDLKTKKNVDFVAVHAYSPAVLVKSA